MSVTRWAPARRRSPSRTRRQRPCRTGGRDSQRRGFLVIEDLEGVTPEAFRGADRNGDGRLTLDEFVNARFRDFDAADTNRDGALTFEEIQVYSGRR